MQNNNDEFYLQQAIELAKFANQQGEVPVGAVLVKGSEIIGRGYNCPISTDDPTAHAEMMAMREAAVALQNYRLIDTTLYVTLEPCMMCAGAMVHARIDRLVYGALDPKTGAITSVAKLLDQPFLNHRVKYQGGVLEAECGHLLKKFFQERR